ncbi:MAG: hypothetical protein JO353_04990, partial [Phycisphaerae bacterium]|nr:hypothetical protein [Phycisphaerae bacterium]
MTQEPTSTDPIYSKPLRIVLALHEAPLPFGGAAAKWYHVLIRALAHEGHRLTVLAPAASREELDATRQSLSDTPVDVRCHLVPTHRVPFQKLHTIRWPFSANIAPSYREDLHSLMRQHVDLLQVEPTSIGYLALPYPDRAVVNAQYLMSIDWKHIRGGSLREQAVRLAARRAEQRLLRRLPRLMTLTNRLAQEAKSFNPRLNCAAVPLALDLNLYPYLENPLRTAGPTVGLIGSFNWTPTLVAGRRLITQLWPAISRERPDARLIIAGRHATRAFNDLSLPASIELHSDVHD